MSAIAKSVSLVMAQSSLTTCSLKLHLIYFCNKKETLFKKEHVNYSLPAKYNHLSPACHLCAKANAKTRTTLLKTSKITPKKNE